MGGKPVTVADGAEQQGDAIGVSCAVTPANAGFDVTLKLTLGGPGGRTLTITSPAGRGAVTPSGGQGITASFANDDDQGPYQESNCTIAFTYQGSTVPDPIAAGRVLGAPLLPRSGAGGWADGRDGRRGNRAGTVRRRSGFSLRGVQ